MSKRNKLKMRNFKIFLAREVFNGRYIIRNILAVTLLVAVVTMTVGITKIIGSRTAEEKPVKQELATNHTIEVTESQQMQVDSISILMADLDANSEANVEANATQVVAESNIVTGIILDNDVYIRAEGSYMGEVIGTADLDDEFNVDKLKSNDEWVCVILEDESYGYVNFMFIEIVEKVVGTVDEVTGEEPTGEVAESGSISEVTNKVDTSADATGSIVQQPTGTTTEAPSTETTTEAPSTEAPTETTTTEQPKREDTVVDGGVPVEVTYRAPITLSEEDINLMASILTLECGGESYDGQLAVANVIINRLQTGYWGSTVSDVVYAPYQFSCVSSPMLDYYIANGAQDSCVQAVREALSGVNNIGGYMCFRATYVTDVQNYDVYTIIGNHVFH